MLASKIGGVWAILKQRNGDYGLNQSQHCLRGVKQSKVLWKGLVEIDLDCSCLSPQIYSGGNWKPCSGRYSSVLSYRVDVQGNPARGSRGYVDLKRA